MLLVKVLFWLHLVLINSARRVEHSVSRVMRMLGYDWATIYVNQCQLSKEYQWRIGKPVDAEKVAYDNMVCEYYDNVEPEFEPD